MRILYVEDNEDNVYVVKKRLTRAGFTILVATDGELCLRLQRGGPGVPLEGQRLRMTDYVAMPAACR